MKKGRLGFAIIGLVLSVLGFFFMLIEPFASELRFNFEALKPTMISLLNFKTIFSLLSSMTKPVENLFFSITFYCFIVELIFIIVSVIFTFRRAYLSNLFACVFLFLTAIFDAFVGINVYSALSISKVLESEFYIDATYFQIAQDYVLFSIGTCITIGVSNLITILASLHLSAQLIFSNTKPSVEAMRVRKYFASINGTDCDEDNKLLDVELAPLEREGDVYHKSLKKSRRRRAVKLYEEEMREKEKKALL